MLNRAYGYRIIRNPCINVPRCRCYGIHRQITTAVYCGSNLNIPLPYNRFTVDGLEIGRYIINLLLYIPYGYIIIVFLYITCIAFRLGITVNGLLGYLGEPCRLSACAVP